MSLYDCRAEFLSGFSILHIYGTIAQIPMPNNPCQQKACAHLLAPIEPGTLCLTVTVTVACALTQWADDGLYGQRGQKM